MTFYAIALSLPAGLCEDQLAVLGGALEDICPAHVARRADNDKNKPWLLTWYCQDEPQKNQIIALLQAAIDAAALPDIDLGTLTINKAQDENWLEKSYQSFQPFTVGPFFIYGSHYEGDIPAEQTGLQIDAATAFGSGEHGTTKGCLMAMLDLKNQGVCPWNILDMGTGSGILAIAAWKLWQTPILAVDIDEESVRVAKHHQDLNGVKDSAAALMCAQGDGFAAPSVIQKKPYELIIANILAAPLKEMAADMKAVMDENGYALLSGMLNRQADEVRAVYEAQGFVFKKRYDLGEWSSLLLHNPAL